MPRLPMSGHGQAAAKAMMTVLAHPRVDSAVNEALFESLLCYTLNTVPGLAHDLFQISPRVFGFGKRRNQPDIVGYDDEEQVVGIEVKIHSKLNFSDGVCQLDNYAAAASPSCRLFVFTADSMVDALRIKMASRKYLTESRDRWRMATTSQLKQSLQRLTSAEPLKRDEAPASLLLALARLG